MKFNVKPSDCRFVVNKDKKTVVCIYEGCSYDFINFINNNCKLAPFKTYFYKNDYFTANLYKKMLMPNRFTGVAVCGPDDEWDEKVGRLIAFSRMKDNLNRSFFKRANTFFNTVDRWLDESAALVNQVGEKLEVNAERRHNLITSLVGEEPSNEDN